MSLIVGPGEQAISSNLAVSQSSAITANGDLTLNNNFSIAAGQTLTKNGPGSLIIQGSQTHGVGASLNVSAGTVSMGTDPRANLQLIVNTASVQFSAANSVAIVSRNLASLNIGSGGLVTIASPASVSQRMVLVTSGLTFTGSLGNWQGQLDLTGNDLIVRNGNVVNLNDQLRSGYNSGGLPGAGIYSSSAAADTTHLTAVGMMINGNSSNPVYTSFDNQPVSSTDVLIKFTYYGDTNLDGEVDGTDYSRVDTAYFADLSNTTSLTGWCNGDFNYDGTVDGSDYTLMDNAFNSQSGQLSAEIAGQQAIVTDQISGVASASSVPEPSAFGLLAAGMIGLLGRRRRLGL